MSQILHFGLPRIHAEPGEKRAFLPEFVGRLAMSGARIILEEGYGATLGYSEEAYRKLGNGNIRFGSENEVYEQEYVLILRCPSDEKIRLLGPASCLIAMLHYPTRPRRVEFLKSLGVEAISLDSLKDDSGRRIVENLRAVGWNGMETAFKVLHEHFPLFSDPKRGPIRVTLLGAGSVGAHVLHAATHYANESLRTKLFKAGVPGVTVQSIDYDTSRFVQYMKPILRETDILVDATQRVDTSIPVIPNEWIGWMPEHAVLLDLSVDPYACDESPASVKGIEGIPQGNLDQFIFSPIDPAFDQIPACVNTSQRRWSVSCYSWPGIYPVECMELYGRQLRPILDRLISYGGIKNINPNGRYFERIIGRALLSKWNISSQG
jgi:alanine dehydrogenase